MYMMHNNTHSAAVSKIQANFQNCYIWALELGLAKVPHIPSFYPRGGGGAKLDFLRYRIMFKIAIFGQGAVAICKNSRDHAALPA